MTDLSAIPFAELKREYIRRVRQRAAAARKVHGSSEAGRPRTKEHCACDAMTLERAAKRRHVCQAPT